MDKQQASAVSAGAAKGTMRKRWGFVFMLDVVYVLVFTTIEIMHVYDS
jgi:hypothetical protein